MIAVIKVIDVVKRCIISRDRGCRVIRVEDEPVDSREVVVERYAAIQTESVVVSHEEADPSS